MSTLLALCLVFAAADDNLLVNGDFSHNLSGWSRFWSRTPGGSATLDEQVRREQQRTVRIEHTGKGDWSLAQEKAIAVHPGEIYELSAWVRVKGPGRVELSVTLRDNKDNVIEWSYGRQSVQAKPGWQLLRSRFVIPPDGKSILPRLIGYGPTTTWLADARLVHRGSIDVARRASLPAELRASTAQLDAVLHTADGTLAVTDRRTGRLWRQKPTRTAMILDATADAHGFTLTLLDPATMLRVKATMQLSGAEIDLALAAEGPMSRPLEFPGPFLSAQNDLLILPLNEGISYPASDDTIREAYHYFYGGHGLCMAWYGQTDGRQGLLTIVDTPDDAGAWMSRTGKLLDLAPRWEPQKEQFGNTRRLRWIFLDDGGYVAMAKRYRAYAKSVGLVKTLAEKRQTNPNVDRLVGAVNVWCWDRDAVAICRELQAAGIERILWSNAASPDVLGKLNAMNVLTSRYDIYQDAMNPANFPKLRYIHRDWTSEAWPKDLMLDVAGEWVRGWQVEAKDGTMYPCGTLCDRLAPDYARRRIAAELKTHPYLCRFIDTTTASPWRECYSPDHPQTRTESRRFKMELLKVISDEFHLVTGSETGHEAAVPVAHYFEGMMSLGPYRVPDSGRDMQRIWTDVPAAVAKFQTGHYYRLPLWELVYHDCLVAQWYWGDYNNKLPVLWDRRDLLNTLYGTPPMFMFRRGQWTENRERFVKSYRASAGVTRATGYQEMLAHRWLTPDHTVQQTEFVGGVRVTVNFGDRPYALAGGGTLAPLASRVEGIK